MGIPEAQTYSQAYDLVRCPPSRTRAPGRCKDSRNCSDLRWEVRSRAPGLTPVLIFCPSVGGLFAARVCSDHFERVVIIEPESWLMTEDARRPDSWNQENKRARVMQYNSLHGAYSRPRCG